MTGTQFFKNLTKIRELGVLLALILMMIVFSISTPHFMRVENILNIVRQISLFGIMALGMTLIIVSGEIDLSIAGIYAFSAIIAGLVMTSGIPIYLAVAISLLSGLAIGILNGFLITYVGIPSLICTLGIVNASRGAALIISGNKPISINYRTVKDELLESFIYAGQGKILGYIPMMAVVFIILAVIFYFIFNKSAFGFHLRAVGGNKTAAKASGINDKKVKIIAYAITGLLCSIAGLLSLSFMASVQSTVGIGVELEVIAAVIIGGTSMAGGDGTIIGSIIGVLIMGVLKNGLVLLGVSPFWSMFSVGVVIITAAAIDTWSKKQLRFRH